MPIVCSTTYNRTDKITFPGRALLRSTTNVVVAATAKGVYIKAGEIDYYYYLLLLVEDFPRNISRIAYWSIWLS